LSGGLLEQLLDLILLHRSGRPASESLPAPFRSWRNSRRQAGTSATANSLQHPIIDRAAFNWNWISTPQIHTIKRQIICAASHVRGEIAGKRMLRERGPSLPEFLSTLPK